MTAFIPESGLSYTVYIALSTFGYFLILSFFIGLISAFIDWLSYHKPPKFLSFCERHVEPNPISMQSVEGQSRSNSPDVEDFLMRPESGRRNPRRKYRNLVFKDCSNCLAWASWVVFSICLVPFSAFGLMSDISAILVSLTLLLLKFWSEITTSSRIYSLNRELNNSRGLSRISCKRRYYTLLEAYNNHPYQISCEIFIIIFFGIFIPLIFSGACFCFFNSDWGINISNEHYNFNTMITRALELEKVCPSEKICHAYITIPEDPSIAFLNIHSGIDVKHLYVSYNPLPNSEISDNLQFTAQISFIKPENLEKKGERLVHTALLTGLIPGKIYDITIRFGAEGHEKNLRYKVPPNDNIRMALGGDVGNTERSRAISSIIGKKFKPDAIFIGGDIAYDNDLRACYYSYDKFLDQMEQIYQDIGYMVPIILALGNHDVGFDAGTGTLKTLDLSSSFYFLYFPQHTQGASIQVPDVSHRRSHHYHRLGSTIFLVLDSGYLQGYELQVTWIQEVSAKYHDKIKFAGYHVPIYTSCTQNFEAQYFGQTFWLPAFDEFKFQAAFEHHQHLLVKTHPLRDNLEDPDGTYYLGDGAWGADVYPNCTGPYPDLSKIFEVSMNVGHFWLMDINDETKTVTYGAYDAKGEAVVPPFNQSYLVEI